ncbi:MAG TPA: MFS transporter [Anaerolineaceae bacterium]|nr:MFS transporter [Anaerolineaceae bacterium]
MSRFHLGSRPAPAESVYLLIGALSTLAGTVMFTIATVFYVERGGLNPFQLVLMGTVLETSVLVFEAPTGVLADTYSRRLSVIIGTFVLGAAFFVMGAWPTAGVLLGLQVVSGLGYTFQSGALDAWLADEVGAENVGRIYLRSGQINRFVGLAGALISVGLASLALRIPMVAGGLIYLALGCALLVIMPEAGFASRQSGESEPQGLKSMLATFKEGLRLVRGRPVLTLLLVASLLFGAASEGYDRLYQAHLLADFTFPALGALQPIVWFGILSAAAGLFTLAVVEIFRRRMEAASQSPALAARVLLILNLGSTACVIIFALTGSFWLAVLTTLLRAALGGLIDPLYNAWLVQSIHPRVRATVLSMVSQGNALGQIVVGPGVGAIGSLISLRAAIATAGLLLAPVSLLFGRAIRSGRLDSRVEVEAPAEA